ncbi:MAG: DUF418 domain-containing protein [Cellvibrionaceae bacterium]|nr:DUF418 domain-containing protein [Cellvibrionaceae bacterium]
MTPKQQQKDRIEGLDFARFLAFVGMVIVNFRIVMGAEGGSDWLSHTASALEGRAAALFVILAGIGLGLSSRYGGGGRTVVLTLKRALFLLVLGLLNRLVFDADILHNYAFFFLFGVILLPLGLAQLVLAIAAISAISVAMFVWLNYDTGWDWNNYRYLDFYTPVGFVRNLFFNGWHPLFPWLAFLVYGLVISRLAIAKRRTQLLLVGAGVAMVLLAMILQQLLLPSWSAQSADMAQLLSTAPIPPMPLYLLSAAGAASVIIGFSLMAAKWLADSGLLALVAPAGRQTLSLYIAHIMLGMGVLEELGLLGARTIVEAVSAAMVFCLLATVFAYYWSKAFKRGPIEMLMRKLAG